MRRRIVLSLAALATFLVASTLFWLLNLTADPPDRPAIWISTGTPSALFLTALWLSIWAVSDNVYRLRAGRVIAHHHRHRYVTAAQLIAGMSAAWPAEHAQEDWMLEIEDWHGHRGILHFSYDVHAKHPVNSYYSRDVVQEE